MLRIPPEVHAAVATAAQVHGVSINQWVSKALLRESALYKYANNQINVENKQLSAFLKVIF